MNDEAVFRDGLGIVPTNFTIHGPKTVPRVDYERIFVLDENSKLLGEYTLRDGCPLEFEDLRRSIPLNGMRHVLSFYQGDYTFTPFHVENLWFVLLTRGVPRIEERGSIGTLLAAIRLHLPPSLSPALAAREVALREREREIEGRESNVTRREHRVDKLEADLQVAGVKMNELEADVRAREDRLTGLRDYALKMQRTFQPSGEKDKLATPAEENRPRAQPSVPPPP